MDLSWQQVLAVAQTEATPPPGAEFHGFGGPPESFDARNRVTQETI
jgi:hypothetical protein